MRRIVVVLVVGLCLVLAGCSGDGDGRNSVQCVDGDYPDGVAPQAVANTISDEWQTSGEAPLVVPNYLQGYEAATSTKVSSPVDGDEFVLGIFRYGSTEEASSKDTFAYARDGQFVITQVATGTGSPSLDAEGEQEDMLTSPKCISSSEYHESGIEIEEV